jgi:general secretion pathway protein D
MTRLLSTAVLLAAITATARAQVSARGSDSIEVRFIDADLRAVAQGLGRYLPKPLVISGLPAIRISLESPGPVPAETAVALLRGLLLAQHLILVEEPAYFTIAAEAPSPQVAAAAADATRSGAPMELFVIRLKHARAADVAGTVNLLFGGTGQFAGSSGLSSPSLSEQLRRDVIPSDRASLPGPVQAAAPAATLAGQTVIVPDELTNALLIRASPGDFETLRGAIEQLDIRPLQVLIEVLIIEVRKDKSFSLGADIRVPQQKVDGGSIGGTLTGGGIGDLVITIMNLGKGRIDAVIRAAASRGDVRIVSQPVLLASNNQEARLMVGTQRPFVQVSRVQPTDNASRDQVVQYKDVGTRLTVRPTINQDRYVSLAIQQEINQATDETQFDAPIISTREARTQVLVRDGQTIVLGGLRDRIKERSQSGVPILSSIPILGGLFGRASRRASETELYLFITPRIIATDAEADSVTQQRLPEGVPE